MLLRDRFRDAARAIRRSGLWRLAASRREWNELRSASLSASSDQNGQRRRRGGWLAGWLLRCGPRSARSREQAGWDHWSERQVGVVPRAPRWSSLERRRAAADKLVASRSSSSSELYRFPSVRWPARCVSGPLRNRGGNST